MRGALTLRPYQEGAVDDLGRAFRDGARSVLHVSPTGSGKTVLFCTLVGDAVSYSKRVLIIGHRTEILDQVSAALAALGISHGMIAPGFPDTGHSVQVASIASLQRRLCRHRDFNFIIVDEAHHAISPSWGQ
jgi:DNA repair protein RadD